MPGTLYASGLRLARGAGVALVPVQLSLRAVADGPRCEQPLRSRRRGVFDRQLFVGDRDGGLRERDRVTLVSTPL